MISSIHNTFECWNLLKQILGNKLEILFAVVKNSLLVQKTTKAKKENGEVVVKARDSDKKQLKPCLSYNRTY